MNDDISKNFSYMNLYEYTYHNEESKKNRETLDLLEYTLLSRIYNYGSQFKSRKPEPKLIFWLKSSLYISYAFFSSLLIREEQSVNIKKGISSSYHSENYHKRIIIHRPIWSPKKYFKSAISFKLCFFYLKLSYRLTYFNFYELVKKENLYFVQEFEKLLKEFVVTNQYSFLIVPNDLDFFSRLMIKIFKEIDKQTILMAHAGVQNGYSKNIDTRTDIITQWGQGQVDSFTRNSHDPNRFIVTGHPIYKNIHKKLQFDFLNILVLTKSISGVRLLDKKFVEDRGNAIVYLLEVQNILSNFNVKNVRLRPHPSERYEWYSNFIDTDFFKRDYYDLQESLKESTLVIGPTSTVFIDALANGVNYVVFEPVIGNQNIFGGEKDDSPIHHFNDHIPIAQSPQQLFEILEVKRGVNPTVLKKFINTSFDTSFLSNK